MTWWAEKLDRGLVRSTVQPSRAGRWIKIRFQSMTPYCKRKRQSQKQEPHSVSLLDTAIKTLFHHGNRGPQVASTFHQALILRFPHLDNWLREWTLVFLGLLFGITSSITRWCWTTQDPNIITNHTRGVDRGNQEEHKEKKRWKMKQTM